MEVGDGGWGEGGIKGHGDAQVNSMDPAGGEDGFGEERSLQGKALNRVTENREGFSRCRKGEKTVGTRCAEA